MRKNTKSLIRKQAKQKKRKDQLRKQAKPTANKGYAYNKLKKATSKMPLLALENEYQSIEPSNFLNTVNSAKNLPEQIDSIFDADTLQKTLQATEQILKREVGDIITINAKTFINIMQSSAPPPSVIGLCVGLYYVWFEKSKDKSFAFSEDGLLERVEEYEKTWNDYLNSKLQAMSNLDKEQVVTQTADTSEALADINDPLQKLVSDVLQSNDKFDELELEDDLQIFVKEYLVEKSIYGPELITAELVNGFVNGWFIENINPLADDVKKMKAHLLALNKTMQDQNLISKDEVNKINTLLA